MAIFIAASNFLVKIYLDVGLKRTEKEKFEQGHEEENVGLWKLTLSLLFFFFEWWFQTGAGISVSLDRNTLKKLMRPASSIGR